MDVRLQEVGIALISAGLFSRAGAYVLVDGQYGSTGKGAIAALLGALFAHKVNIVTTNAGPNSGHTGYWSQSDAQPWQKVMTQQIPVFSAVARMLGHVRPVTYLNGGAIIDPDILRTEAEAYKHNRTYLKIHGAAAMIDGDYKTDDAESTSRIATTNKGVGRALARKVMREKNVAKYRMQDLGYFSEIIDNMVWRWDRDVVFVETAQGYSLGINQPFHPYVTSRECSVNQAIADANIPYTKVRQVIMSLRTYPIRVGNTDKGESGHGYSDQQETTWEALGVQPELTTVTKRVRRVFTWSDNQFMDAVEANQPDILFMNFMQYIRPDEQLPFMNRVISLYRTIMNKRPDCILAGYGPLPTDIKVWA